jgi:hypothetical protein
MDNPVEIGLLTVPIFWKSYPTVPLHSPSRDIEVCIHGELQSVHFDAVTVDSTLWEIHDRAINKHVGFTLLI